MSSFDDFNKIKNKIKILRYPTRFCILRGRQVSGSRISRRDVRGLLWRLRHCGNVCNTGERANTHPSNRGLFLVIQLHFYDEVQSENETADVK